MVALFTPTVFSTKGWLLEEEPLSYDVSSKNSFPYQFYSLQTQIEVEIERSTAPSPDDPAMVKKLSHNDSERDRRKKVNNLVSSLRLLLPVEDQTKKMSIPATVSRVLKYIPELQHQVQALNKKKEELLCRISKNLKGDSVNKESQRRIAHHNSDFVVSTSRLNIQERASPGAADKAAYNIPPPYLRIAKSLWTMGYKVFFTSRLNDCEAVVHISFYEVHKVPLSEILHCLENNGLLLLNASSSETFGGRFFYNLHFQVEKAHRLESEILTEKLLSIYEKQRIF
ncbi:Transcription factor ORG2 [Glycine soja]|uniref:Transcription factor ORG2 n=1 Tax=Glycine soja TaxID=3848 RepID=A0A445FG32_GLYSO|nr:Transcription factor ORG2 [Glycine soja]